MRNNGSRPEGEQLHLETQVDSSMLSGAEQGMRASAFNDGVRLEREFMMTRCAILGTKTQPRRPTSEQFAGAFAHLAARAIRRYPRVLRHLLTTEFIAGLLSNLLAEQRWQCQIALTESEWAQLTTTLRRRSRARWRSRSVRTQPTQEYEPQARAREDGRKLAETLCLKREAIPDRRTNHEQWEEVVGPSAVELVDTAIAAVATYPFHLRDWMTAELVGVVLATVLPQNAPDSNPE
jgi:hypothetical protein